MNPINHITRHQKLHQGTDTCKHHHQVLLGGCMENSSIIYVSDQLDSTRKTSNIYRYVLCVCVYFPTALPSLGMRCVEDVVVNLPSWSQELDYVRWTTAVLFSWSPKLQNPANTLTNDKSGQSTQMTSSNKRYTAKEIIAGTFSFQGNAWHSHWMKFKNIDSTSPHQRHKIVYALPATEGRSVTFPTAIVFPENHTQDIKVWT